MVAMCAVSYVQHYYVPPESPEHFGTFPALHRTGIGEVCPAMSGTPGFMAHECMSMKPVRGTAAQDVVGVAMVLLLVCLKKELRSPNLFANPVRSRGCDSLVKCSAVSCNVREVT